MRYYFHLRMGQTISPDELGLELPDLETACLEAFKAAQEMWSELLAERSDPLVRSFEIADEHGQVLLTLPFREVLERAHKPTGTLPTLTQTLKAELEKRKILAASLQEQIKATRKTVETTRKTLDETSGLLAYTLRGGLAAAAEKIRPTILVAEDEVLLRMMIADQLRSAGYSVVEAASAQEALDVLAHCFDVKLILSDVRMPGSMDGVGLARLVRSEYPGVKVLLTSGHSPAIDAVEHDGFFPKPYDPAQIIIHIKTFVSEETPAQRRVIAGSRER